MNHASEHFVERMGLNFSDEGVPRIAGRLLGLLLLSDAPRSLDDLAETLQVSKGSISTNARLLQQWGVIERVSRPGDRRDYYQTVPDGTTRLLEIQIERLRRMQTTFNEARETIAFPSETVRRRFKRISAFQATALKSMQQLLEDWGRNDASRP